MIRRLEHLAALATTKRARRAGQLLLAAALVFFLLRFRRLWGESGFSFDRVDWPLLVLAVAVTSVGVAATAFIWLAILRRLGVATERRLTGVFFQAQFAKYIPGSVWQYAGRTTLAKAAGLSLPPVVRSLAFEIAASSLASGAISLLFFGAYGAVGAAAVVALFVMVSRIATRSSVATAARAAVPYVAVWICFGFGFWLTARALFAVPWHDLPRDAGAFAIAWLAGFVAIYAPGGVGVREAVLVALLRDKLGSADALVLAVASRLIFAVIDVTAAGVGIWMLRGSRSAVEPVDRPVTATRGAP